MFKKKDRDSWNVMLSVITFFAFVAFFADVRADEPMFPSKQIRFNYADTEVDELLRFFGKESGFTVVNSGGFASVVLDPISGRPAPGKNLTPARGGVTVMSDALVSLDQAFIILQDLLQGVGTGYNLVVNREKKIIQVVPGANTAQRLLPITVGMDPDKIPEGEGVIKHIAFLKNLRATQNLRGDIQLIMPNGATVLLNEQANGFVFVASTPAIRHILTVLKNLDEAFTAIATVKVYTLKYAVARELIQTLRTVFGALLPGRLTDSTQQAGMGGQVQYPQGGVQPGGSGQRSTITVVEHGPTNSVVVLALNEQHSIVEEAIKKLDRLPAQVMVETMIVEVGLNNDLRHGVDWLFRTGADPGRDNLGGIIESPIARALALTGISALVPPQYLIQMTKDKVDAFLRVLEERTNVKVVANPRVYCMDNQKARVQSGSKIPFLTSIPGPVGTQPVQNIDQRDVGILLEFEPHINEDRTINMKVKQEISSVSQQTFFGAPVIDTRVADTTIMVKDGMSVILGGMIREETRNVNRQVPLLGDLPLIGFLFKSTQAITQRQELLVILTPHVATSPEEVEKFRRPGDQKFLDDNLKK